MKTNGLVCLMMFVCALSLGCADKVSEQDLRARSRLVGTWYTTWADDGGGIRHVLVHVRADGSFDSRTVVRYKDGSGNDESTGGEWFVTDGLFKRLHKLRGDKPVPSSEFKYETCRIVTLIESHLDCAYDVAGGQNNYERVHDSFQIPAS